MTNTRIHLGETTFKPSSSSVNFKTVTIDGEDFYKIENSDAMRSFLMSIVSDSNHWLYTESNGGISAGRKDSNSALFPYYTDDKLTELAESTGNKTIFLVNRNGINYLWQPFSDNNAGTYFIQRNLYKNTYGNKVIFEEINQDLGLSFRYEWNTSNAFGFVKKATLRNYANQAVTVRLLDGLQNLMPAGVPADLQNSTSNLVDAYKKNELEADSGVGIFSLSAVIVDKAEPSEALKATVVWSLGIENPLYLLSSLQLPAFQSGEPVQQETDIRAEKGSYFVVADVAVEANGEKKWQLMANVNQTATGIENLIYRIKNEPDLAEAVQADIDEGTQNLVQLNGSADGIQLSADPLVTTRHFANTLFNNMRGGIFDNNYTIEKADFLNYLQKANKRVFAEQKAGLTTLSTAFTLEDLKTFAAKAADADFQRLAYEYLPLKFSRRHGDPSRPWNKFSINTRSETDGSKILDYQGNWRDIFQNWEALAQSYPAFLAGMIYKFLNASTFDGYNPYRVTKDGFDWEVIEEHDPWSYIGYWGDHQIIYLLKFLETMEAHYPGQLAGMLTEAVFVYANVPYKIKAYPKLLENPKDTIDFDYKLDAAIRQKREEMGADGALLTTADNAIYKVSMLEKLLVTLLAKVANFIPEGGIWMNTQRPEWNDANNALVGNGVSMVTLYYMFRYVGFLQELLRNVSVKQVDVSGEFAQLFHQTNEILDQYAVLLSGAFTGEDRKSVLDGLGTAASHYRTKIYDEGFSGKKSALTKAEILHLLETLQAYFIQTIAANEREDKLYHAYNLMSVSGENAIGISHLPKMLEGQVAVLSSGYLSAAEAIEVLAALRNSDLYRPDQNSYILYPNKRLPRFLDKNTVPQKYIDQSALLQQLLADGNTQIVEKDVNGNVHFNANFNNAEGLKAALKNLPDTYDDLVKQDAQQVLETYEAVFNHKAFTGRSGTFFGYEGLGSIYWHMVSKLLLAVQENLLAALKKGEEQSTIGQLINSYYEVQAGIGVHKSPQIYGAFPTDPYSHTPAGKGAQQPGMTGQVKEDVLCRIGELGVGVADGRIHFRPHFLRVSEFLPSPQTFRFVNIAQAADEISLPAGSLAFTYCQVPIIYRLGENDSLAVTFAEGSTKRLPSLELDNTLSRHVFNRSGKITQIDITLGPQWLFKH